MGNASLKTSLTTTDVAVATAPTLVSVPRGMDVTASQGALKLALAHLAHVADRKSYPILGYVAMRTSADGLRMVTTDLTVTLTVTVPGATVVGMGGFCVPVKALSDMTKAMPGPSITLATIAGGIRLDSGKVTSKLIGIPDREFPKVPTADIAIWSVMDGATMADMIDGTAFSVCTDETRFHLNGCLLESTAGTVRMVSTDGHRLTMVQRTGQMLATLAKGVLIPRKALTELARMLDSKAPCKVAFDKGFMYVRQESWELAIRLSDAQFPPYEQVIPRDQDTRVTCSRKALIEACQRTKLLASDIRGIKLSTAWGALVITSDNPDTGDMTETIEADAPDRDVKIGVNPRYLIELLAHMTGDRVTLAFGKELDPVLVREAADSAPLRDASHLGVIMPMRF